MKTNCFERKEARFSSGLVRVRVLSLLVCVIDSITQFGAFLGDGFPPPPPNWPITVRLLSDRYYKFGNRSFVFGDACKALSVASLLVPF